MRVILLVLAVVSAISVYPQSNNNTDAVLRRCNAHYGDYSDFAQSHDFPFSLNRARRQQLTRACGGLSVGMSETELLRQMGAPNYIEPENLNDVRKGGCRWTWVVTDPTPKGDQPDGKYQQLDAGAPCLATFETWDSTTLAIAPPDRNAH